MIDQINSFFQKTNDNIINTSSHFLKKIEDNSALPLKAKEKIKDCLEELKKLSLNQDTSLLQVNSLVATIQTITPFSESQDLDKISQMIQTKYETLYLLKTLSEVEAPQKWDLSTKGRLKKAVALIDQGIIFHKKSHHNLILLCATSPDPFLRSLVMECIKNGANIHSSDVNGFTPIFLACDFDDIDLVLSLWKAGASFDYASDKVLSAMDYLLETEKFSFIFKLVEEGLDIDYQWGNKILGIEILKGTAREQRPGRMLSNQEKLRVLAYESIPKLFSLDSKQTHLHAVLQCAVEKKDKELIKNLVNSGTSLSQSDKENEVIAMICDALFESKNWSSCELAFVEKLAKHKTLHLYLLKNGTPAIFIALKKNERLREIVANAYELNGSEIHIFEEIGALAELYHTIDDLAYQIEINHLINELLDQLNIDLKDYRRFLVKQFKDLDKRKNKVLEWIEREEKLSSPIEFLRNNRFSKERTKQQKDSADICSVCLSEQKYDLIGVALSKSIYLDNSKEKVHFLLDKVDESIPLNPYESGYIVTHALHLQDSFSQILIALKEEKIQSEEQQLFPIYERLIKSLQICARWDTMDNVKTKAKEIVETLNRREPFPILIPSGFQEHAMVISVEFLPNEKWRFIVYNTGDGLEHHYKSTDGKKYQTHLIIEEVDEQLLLNKEMWENILSCRISEKTADPLYTLIKKIGPILPPSNNSFDYEQPQMRGTCSAQCLMAALRKLVMDYISGSDIHKLMGYNLLKARSVRYIGLKNLDETDKIVKELSEKKIAKLSALLELNRVANSLEDFQEHLKTVKKVCEELNENTFFENLIKLPTHTAFERLYLLRLYASKIHSIQKFE